MIKRLRGYSGIAVLLGLVLLAGFGCNGGEPQQVTPQDAAPDPAAGLAFTDVTAEAGLGDFRHVNGAFGEKWMPESVGSGGGFIDYDGDGWLDVLLVGGGVWPGHGDAVPALRLYRNNGDPGAGPGQAPTFAETTREAGLADLNAYGFGISVADYDNDGDADFYFTTLTEDKLFRNENGVFTDVAGTSGVVGEPVWSTSALFFDADADGHLDLYVGSYVDWSPEKDIVCLLEGETRSYCTPQLYDGLPGRFYHNNGDGTFTDQTETAGFLPGPGKTLGVAELDFNRDGFPDLVIANDTQPDELYQNNGDGTFTERGQLSGMAFDENGKSRAGMGVDVGVVDDTGQETMFVGNFSKEMIGVYRHIGNGLFVDRAALSQIGRPSLLTLTFSLFLFDVDLDGDLDLFAANGHLQPEIEQVQEGIGYREPPHLFVNRGDGTFEDVSPALGGVLMQPIVARGAAYADYDRDGDLDVLVTENGGPAHLWRNDLQRDDHVLRVRLEGRRNNRDGLSSRIVAVVGGRRMERRVRSGSSYLSASETVATFGLGASSRVDSLLIYWPGGAVERFADVVADQEVLVVEGAGALEGDTMPGRAREAL